VDSFAQIGTGVRLVNTINCDKFCGNRLRNLNSVGVKFRLSPFTQACPINTVPRYLVILKIIRFSRSQSWHDTKELHSEKQNK